MAQQIKVLTGKKEATFARISSLYETSKKITAFDSRSNEKFLNDTESIDELAARLELCIDRINEYTIQEDPTKKPDYQALIAGDELLSTIKRVRNKILASSTERTAQPRATEDSKLDFKLKLPPIEIPSFDGKTEHWPIFYESFKANIHDNEKLTDSHRVQYLIGKLTHDALGITAGIVPTGDTYKILWEALVKRYQDKRLLGTHYLNNILSLKQCTHTSGSLTTFVDKFSASMAVLKNLEIRDLLDFMFLHLALMKMDSQTKQAFELSVRDVEQPTTAVLITFVQDQIKILERSGTVSGAGDVGSKSSLSKPFKTTKSFVVAKKTSCAFCKSDEHLQLYFCSQFKLISPQKRLEFIKSRRGCVNCLSTTHNLARCESRRRCSRCEKSHHTLLCFTNTQTADASRMEAPAQPNVSSINVAASSETPMLGSVLLATAQVYAHARNGQNKIIRCLVDNGSQNNLITRDCCNLLNLSIVPLNNSCIRGVGLLARPILGYVELSIASRVSPHKYRITALVVDCITDQLPPQKITPFDAKYLQTLPLADLTWQNPGEIDLLIGAQLFPFIYLGNRVESSSTAPPAIETTFGYVLMGDIPTTWNQSKLYSASFSAVTLNDLDLALHRFWELEEISQIKPLSPEEVECENIFKATLCREQNGRFSVTLPFCRDASALGDSRGVAHRRFLALERKLKKDSDLRLMYHKVILEYLKEGYLSESDSDLTDGYFIPHHGVLKQESSTTKLRVVLDASAKTHTGFSLNDLLHAGPNLQTDLFLLLLNFRLFPVAITADIKQMYLQLEVNQSHRKFLKILFRFHETDQIKTFQFNRLPFGLKCSPYLAMKTLRYLATESEDANNYPEASQIVNSRLYMDDLVHSVSDEQSAKRLSWDLIELLQPAGFNLVKWNSNSALLLGQFPESYCAQFNFGADSEKQKVLGLSWLSKADVFHISTSYSSEKCTKRSILSFIARLFDVLGLVSPVVLYAKLLVKELWQEKIAWDAIPPELIIKKFVALTDQLPLLSQLTIPRHIGVTRESNVTIVGFCDASLNAYGAVIYIQSTDSQGNISVQLLCSKSKVAPVKIETLARLELCAALLLSKLIRTVVKTYETRISISGIYAFSDSTITLSWLHSSPHRWSIFVSNRVAQCQANLDSKHFYHIPGKDNPSDCLSRGMLPGQLKSHPLWWKGPTWLKTSVKTWPITTFKSSASLILPELKTTILSHPAIININDSPLGDLISKISNYDKLLRVMVYIMRFTKRLPRSATISSADVLLAEQELIKFVQAIYFSNEITLVKNNKIVPHLKSLCPFMDEHGVLRIEGRLRYSNLPFEAKHPALLPGKGAFTENLIDRYHRMNCHTGANLLMAILRQRFWILSARNVVRRRISGCNVCFRTAPTHPSPKMADLPSVRICDTKAFTNTGVDYAGPIQITLTRRRGIRSQKAYICLFVCLVTKALHIELVTELSTDAFIAAFKRFISRRGTVSCLYSDNGTNFVGARMQLDELYTFLMSKPYYTALNNELIQKRIEWKMIPPRAPHFGGIWEANIKCVKRHLYRVIGSQILSYEEMSTVLIQIESLLNSRPLCLISSEPNPEVLTPAHFLMSTPLQYLPATDVTDEKLTLTERKKLLDQMVDSYWRKWRLEYLQTLQGRAKWFKNEISLQIGTVVLLNQDNTPPLHWPLGVVTEVHPGRDGVVRVATVKTVTGTYKRPVVKLCPLPTQ